MIVSVDIDIDIDMTSAVSHFTSSSPSFLPLTMTQAPDYFLLLVLIFILYHDRQVYQEYRQHQTSLTDALSKEKRNCLKVIKKTKYKVTILGGEYFIFKF